MVFLSFNVCNPAFFNANDQNQNLIKTRLFNTFNQKCLCLDALMNSFHNNASYQNIIQLLYHSPSVYLLNQLTIAQNLLNIS
jgi:hypothetical protein